MENYRQLAINECYFNGVGLTGVEFDKSVKEYNNFEMSLTDRHKRIASKMEPLFIDFIKKKYGI